ncbi:hypothetical protein LTR08_002330 [Meristemomyces frigidus]|nr:hypothetical protein LTR08_002330 [Meristemomyces frigidus]
MSLPPPPPPTTTKRKFHLPSLKALVKLLPRRHRSVQDEGLLRLLTPARSPVSVSVGEDAGWELPPLDNDSAPPSAAPIPSSPEISPGPPSLQDYPPRPARPLLFAAAPSAHSGCQQPLPARRHSWHYTSSTTPEQDQAALAPSSPLAPDNPSPPSSPLLLVDPLVEVVEELRAERSRLRARVARRDAACESAKEAAAALAQLFLAEREVVGQLRARVGEEREEGRARCAGLVGEVVGLCSVGVEREGVVRGLRREVEGLRVEVEGLREEALWRSRRFGRVFAPGRSEE